MARILVVEDDRGVIELLTEVLEKAGHEVTLVLDGQEAYRRVFLEWPEFDAILCDLELPSMQGPDLLARLQGQVRGRTPVVVVSGKDRLIDSLGEARQWVVDVVRKPFRLEELEAVVAKALVERARLRSHRVAEDRLERCEMRVRELEQRVHDLVEDNVALFEEAREDMLSGLPNRRRLHEDLGKKHANTDRYGSPFALAFCDIDDFRRFNENFGYQGGDRAIQHLANLLNTATREGDTVYRYGGDEFVVVMEAQNLRQGIGVADRLRKAVAAGEVPEAIGGSAERITMSVGVADARQGEDRDITTLVNEANEHLSTAKVDGGNCVRPKRWNAADAAD